MKKYKISDILELIDRKPVDIKNTKEGQYPLISRVDNENGISRYVSEY